MSLACTGASQKKTVVTMSSSSSSSSKQMFMPIFSKVEELITNYTHNIMESIKDFKLNLESLHKSLVLLNAKASNIEEQIKFLDGYGKKKRKWEIEDWLRRVAAIESEVIRLGPRAEAESEGFIKSMMDGGNIARLNEEVVTLLEQSKHFDELLNDACGTWGVKLLTTRIVGKALDENIKKIWNLLGTREVSSIGVHGMGGVGKTALVKCINNRLLKQSQVRVFWITVSHEFTIKSLQDKIASFLGLNFLNENDEEIRAARLHSALSEIKNSVLILDDLWENINLLKVGCHVSMQCCRLIVTTRSLEVCRQMRCQRIIAVKTLDEGEAWKLFIRTLASGEHLKLDPRVEEVAISMTNMCGGLPLGIINMAERMRGVTSIHSWAIALAELMESPAMQDGVFRALKYSFDRLNSQNRCKEFNLFQRCFLYCSLYPRIPPNKELVVRFISEGLVDGSKSRRTQIHHGHSILDKLVNVSLLEVDGGSCVKMHDLVRGMALKISEGKSMVRMWEYRCNEIPNEEEWTEDLEKVFLMSNGIRFFLDGMSPNCPPLIPSPNCPRLSTLLLQDYHLTAIPDAFFSKMKQLTSLDLCMQN